MLTLADEFISSANETTVVVADDEDDEEDEEDEEEEQEEDDEDRVCLRSTGGLTTKFPSKRSDSQSAADDFNDVDEDADTLREV